MAQVLDNVREALNEREAGWDEYPNAKADHMKLGCCGCEVGVDGDAGYYKRLQRDLGTTYRGWSSNCFMDYIYFILNWHPLLGMMFCHPNHPWTKRERIEMVLVSLALTIVPAAAITNRFHDSPGRLHVAATYLFVTIPDGISGILLYQLSTLDARFPSAAPVIQGAKRCCLGCTVVFAAIMCFIGYLILKDCHSGQWRVIQSLALGKAMSWLTWFPIQTVVFLICWLCLEKPEDNAKEDEGKGLTQDSP